MFGSRPQMSMREPRKEVEPRPTWDDTPPKSGRARPELFQATRKLPADATDVVRGGCSAGIRWAVLQRWRRT